jgi:hypothetical protein
VDSFTVFLRPGPTGISSLKPLDAHCVTLTCMNHCYLPLASESQALAQKAEQDGTLGMLEGVLHCECGARVGALRKPYLDGPKGGPLHPTTHSPYKPPRPLARKRYASKRCR